MARPAARKSAIALCAALAQPAIDLLEALAARVALGDRDAPCHAVDLHDGIFTRARDQMLHLARAYPVDRLLAVFRAPIPCGVNGLEHPHLVQVIQAGKNGALVRADEG